MLLSPSMRKFDLDKSSNSVMGSFLRKFNGINLDLGNLEFEFIDLLNTVIGLQTDLSDITSTIKEQISEIREDWTNAGLDTTPLDEVEEIVERAEEELSEEEKNIDEAVSCRTCYGGQGCSGCQGCNGECESEETICSEEQGACDSTQGVCSGSCDSGDTEPEPEPGRYR